MGCVVCIFLFLPKVRAQRPLSIIVALLVGFLFVILVTIFANMDVTTQHRTVATIVIVGGQLLTAAQTMGIFRVAVWEEPFSESCE